MVFLPVARSVPVRSGPEAGDGGRFGMYGEQAAHPRRFRRSLGRCGGTGAVSAPAMRPVGRGFG